MKSTTVLALASLALAAPMENRDNSGKFMVLNSRSGSPVHFTPWIIRDGGIYTTGQTSGFCSQGPRCSDYDSSVSAFSAAAGGPEQVMLANGPPFVQYLYVGEDGALGYNHPHSSVFPEGAQTDVFERDDYGGNSYLDTDAKGLGGFLACPVDSGYQMYAAVDGVDFSNCLGVQTLANPYDGKSAYGYD